MSIPNSGFVVYIKRLRNEIKKGAKKNSYRTVGEYKCYLDGVQLHSTNLMGATAEPSGPGNNQQYGKDRGRRIEAGTYQLGTHDGTKYDTFGYNKSKPRPGIYVHNTEVRSAILIHVGSGFKSTVGCINLTKSLVGPHDNISKSNSFRHVDALIKSMKVGLPHQFPTKGAKRLKDAWLVIEGEP